MERYNKLMKLSVVIASYNTVTLLERTVTYLRQRLQENSRKGTYEVIVVDNSSTDGTVAWLKKQKDVIGIYNKENVGFGRANNQGIRRATGDYLLLLNSDVLLEDPVDFRALIAFLEEERERGALTIKLYLDEVTVDASCHRGFPTPFNALCYFTGVERLLLRTPFAAYVGGYHLTHLPLTTVHEIDCPSAAFFLIKKAAMDSVEGFDPDYFFYAEDIDLCYRIKQNGWSIWFYPQFKGLHLKSQSGKRNPDRALSRHSRYWFFKSMGMFYDKHYLLRYPRWVSGLVHLTVTLFTRFYAR